MKLPTTSGLARTSALHPWRVVGVWVMLLALAGAMLIGVGMDLTTEVEFTNNPDSKQGTTLLEDRLRGEDPVTETIVIRSQNTTVDDPAFKALVDQTKADLLALDGVVGSVTTYYDTDNAALVSADRNTTIIPVTLIGSFEDAETHTDEYVDAVDANRAEGYEVYTVGDVSIADAFNTISEEDIQTAEGFGMPIALIILVVVFGALVAAGVPILLALVAMAVSLGVTAVVSQAFELSFFVTNMITMIGLAVGIDYSLFIVERYREERRRGIAKIDAISIAGGTASKAVVFSGITVVLALAGMFIVPTSIFQSLGAGAVIVVIVSVFATLTLIPAMIGLLGDKLDWPRRRKYDAAAIAAQQQYDHETIHKGFWGRITAMVMRRPVVAVVIALVLLIGATIPYFDMRSGTTGVESLPESDVKSAFEILHEDFYVGVLAPVEIVIDGPATDIDVQAGINSLVEDIEANDQFGSPTVETNEAGDLTLVSAPLVTDANSEASADAVTWLRESIIPATFNGSGADVYVTGDAAANEDLNAVIEDYTPIVFTFVLGLSFILLTLAFRSIIVPIKAILMNLLSVGAAYGLLVLMFQKGYGEFLGFSETPAIEPWLPIFLFCVLFGLSMDYHVFLLSRIREHYDATGRNRESVAVGLQSTAKIITGAALIMVAVFGGFASGQLVFMQQMGFGLAAAVFIDATLVRSVLVPAAMALLGDRNWYLPRWLHWLPDLRVEGAAAHVEAAPVPVIAGGGDD
ncbi:MAG TPA: MMPL family transporter [Thermomicrobiales bacterium]|nr:MMPL family transporter [Thermomicrobiales bacterium]